MYSVLLIFSMEVLLIIILSFFALGYILRLLAPYILRWYGKRMMKRFGFTEEKRKEGEVTINKTTSTSSKKKKTVAKDVGDYVDFEEVK